MLFVLVPNPLDVCSGVFVVGGACGACGCVETCYGEEVWRVGVVVFISVLGLHYVVFI